MAYGSNAYGAAPYGSTGQQASSSDGTASVTGAGSVAALATVIAGQTVTGAGSTSAGGASVGPYVAEVLADSPLFYWRLGEPSGATAQDETANNRDGTYVNTPTLGATGIPGGGGDTAVTFNGTDEYVSIADAAWMDVTNVTVEAWFKIDSAALTPGIYNAIIDRGNGTFSVWVNKVGSNAYLYAKLLGAGSTLAELDYTTASVGDNAWHHVALTHDGTTVRLYLDGTEVDTFALAQNVQSDTQGILVGASLYSSPASFFKGSLDEAAVYGTALSASRISARYNIGKPTGASASGVGSVTAKATIQVSASVTGSGSTSATTPSESGYSTVTGAGSTSAAVTIEAAASVAGAGSTSGSAVGSSGETGSASGAGSVTALATTVSGKTIAGVGGVSASGYAAITANTVQGVGYAAASAIVGVTATSGSDRTFPAVTAEDPTVTDGFPAQWKPYAVTEMQATDWRVVVGGVDVTTINGHRTLPASPLRFVEPFGETTVELILHGVTRHLLETSGYEWCRPGADVRINKHDATTGALVGNLGSFVVYNILTDGATAGSTVRLVCSGALSGPAGVTHYKPPVAGQTGDVADLIRQALEFTSRRHIYAYTGTVGVSWTDPATEFGSSAATVLDRVERLLLEAYTTGRWTIARTTAAATYNLVLKDTTTVNATVTLGSHGVREDLRQSLAESPGVIYGSYSTQDLPADSPWRTAPLAYDPKVDPYLYDGTTGAIIGANPSYDPSKPRVERYITVGNAVPRVQAAALAQRLIFDPDNLPWFGTIEVSVGVPSGNYNGTGPAAGHVAPLDFREGWNVRVRGLPGNPILHVAGVDLDIVNNRATLTLDEGARDFMEVSALLSKNRDPISNELTQVDPIRSYTGTYGGGNYYWGGDWGGGGGYIGDGGWYGAPPPFTKSVDPPDVPDGWGWLRPI